jgi:hypothetical protein
MKSNILLSPEIDLSEAYSTRPCSRQELPVLAATNKHSPATSDFGTIFQEFFVGNKANGDAIKQLINSA